MVAPVRALASGRAFPGLLGGALTLVLALLMTTGVAPTRTFTYRVGDVARRDIKAPRDMQVEDPLATEARQQEARERVRAHYDIDTKLGAELEGRIRIAFEAIQRLLITQTDAARNRLLAEQSQRRSRELIPESRVSEEAYQSDALRAAEEAFARALEGRLPPNLLEWLRAERYSNRIRDDLIKLVRAALAPEIVSDRQLYAAHAARGIIVRDIRSGNPVSLSGSLNPIELRGVESFLRARAGQLRLTAPPELRDLLIAQAAKLARPTLTFNSRATVESEKEAASGVEPVSQLIKEGEMIVREGERISESQLIRLKSLEQTNLQRHVLDNLIGTALVVSLLLLLAWVCAQRYQLGVLRGTKSLPLFVLLLTTQAILIKLGVVFAHNLHETYRGIGLLSFYYLIPFASASLLAALLLGRSSAVFMSVMSGVMTAMLMPGKAPYALMALAGGIYAATRWKNYRHRSSILVAGLVIGIINATLALGFNMQEGFTFALARWTAVPLAFAGGIANVVVVSAVMPLLESLFKLTTDMRLLELADQNHPLLRQMVLRAPGTYHHSLMVGNLSEEAAEAVGAHALLTRVGAYFHDIGKMQKSEYFIENQGRENRHDRLSPSMSALILISHVKEGAELGRGHKLPKEIIDLIAQHHGTALIRYFYDKAKNQTGGEDLREEAFCYPGPKPQTREAGILMLADIVEASSRTLSDTSPARLSGLVERVVQSAFAEGQLDECNLTLRNLGRIQEAFLRVLAGIHHHRVSYPGQPAHERKGATNGGAHLKPAKAGAARSASPTPAGRGNPGKSPIER